MFLPLLLSLFDILIDIPIYFRLYFSSCTTKASKLVYFSHSFFFNFIFKLYIIVLVLPNIKMNPPQVYMCSPSWTLLPPPSPFHPSGSSQCTSPKHPVSCIEPRLATRFIHDILHVSHTQLKICFNKWMKHAMMKLLMYLKECKIDLEVSKSSLISVDSRYEGHYRWIWVKS